MRKQLKVRSYWIQEHNRDKGLSEITLDRLKQRDGSYKWAIRRGSDCFTREGYFIYEPLPSSRTEDYFIATRFGSVKEALNVWNKFYSEQESGE